MIPVGKTYLIEVENKNDIDLVNGIYVPNNSSVTDSFYEGIVKEHGTLWTEEERKDLVPIGTKIFLKWNEKSGTKLIMGQKAMYIVDKEKVIAIVDEENKND